MRPKFTLSQLIVVAALIVIVISAGAVLSGWCCDRSRTTRTISLIKTLHDGCLQYRSLEMFKKYPEYEGGSSKPLHRQLGSPTWICKILVLSGGPPEANRPPIVNFNPGWLEGAPMNTDPNACGAREIVDAWKRPIRYEAYPGARYAVAMDISAKNARDYVSIWSLGPNGCDDWGDPASDDLGNWDRVGRTP